MIVLTGGAGFVGSRILKHLNSLGRDDVLLFDDLGQGNQFRNLVGLQHAGLYSTKEYIADFSQIECVIHCGAVSSTLENHWPTLYEANVKSTRKWHDLCIKHGVKFIFTSSAAVYGNGTGPLNHYAFSKVLSENEITDGVILRLFNVYGPGESHKGRMASTPYHWYHQLKRDGILRCFKNSEGYYRDFVWVDDVAKTVAFFVENYKPGLYEVGTGKPYSFYSLANDMISKLKGDIKFINMPEDLVAQYQTHTRANINHLEKAGLDVEKFILPKQGIDKYCDYLSSEISL